MSEYAAFLRGMNVGGHRVSNVELGARFEELGFSEVSTFRASGNVIFAAAAEPLAEHHINESRDADQHNPNSAQIQPSRQTGHQRPPHLTEAILTIEL
jgi:hypothetical protein